MILRRFRLWAAGVTLVLAMNSPLQASLPPPPSHPLDRLRDLTASVRARRVLKDDPLLAPLNLGVSVADGVASVWGPVPSADVGKKAVERLRTVRGIREVRASFYPETPREQNLLGDLVRRHDTPLRFEVGKPNTQAAPPPEPARVPLPAVVTHGTGRVAVSAAPQVFAPRAVETPAERPPSVVPRPAALLDRVSAVRRSDPRFAAIVITVSGTRVKVQQGTAADNVIHDLLTQLRRLPGLTDIELASD